MGDYVDWLVVCPHRFAGVNTIEGRPAQALPVVSHAACTAAADIGHTHVHVMLCDLSGPPGERRERRCAAGR